MLRFPNTLGVIFAAGMTQIAWRARMVGSARCADRTPQRGVPTVVLTRIDFERLTNDVISSGAKHLWKVAGAQDRQMIRDGKPGLADFVRYVAASLRSE